MPGPAPKPTKLKQLAGNPGRRPLNDAEPEFQPDDGDVPAGLDLVGIEEWNRIVPQLRACGIFTKCDRSFLILYCKAVSAAVQADSLNKFETYTRLAMSLGKEFGLTPASRSKLAAKPGEADDDDARFFGEEPRDNAVQ